MALTVYETHTDDSGLDRAQTIDAISQAWADGQSLRTYRHAPNTGSRKSWAAGDACSRAVNLAYLVKKGEKGMPSVLTAKTWGFYDVLFKVCPSSRHYGRVRKNNYFPFGQLYIRESRSNLPCHILLTSWKTYCLRYRTLRNSTLRPPWKLLISCTPNCRAWARVLMILRAFAFARRKQQCALSTRRGHSITSLIGSKQPFCAITFALFTEIPQSRHQLHGGLSSDLRRAHL